MAEHRTFELDELTIRPGTYFNPQTEVLLVVDDSPDLDHEIFNMEDFEGEEWVLVSDESPVDEHRRDELIERFDLDPHKKARTYSKGNRQKVSLISAFSSRARLLLLDEPSSGLDPLMESVFQQCVGEARDRGATVLLSSHILAETEALCERVTIIRSGKTIESGSLDSLRHLSRTSIKAEMTGDPGDLTRIKGVENVSVEGNTLRAQVDSESLGELIRVLGDAGVRSLLSQPPTLEELFLRHYKTGGGPDSKGQRGHSGRKVSAL